MKNLIFLSILFFSANKIYSQNAGIAINPTLQKHLFANHTARETSMNNFRNMYKKQSDWYKNVETKMTQVLIIHEQIYQALYNVNSLFKQSKQLGYIYSHIQHILNKTLPELLRVSRKYPQYAIFLKKYYQDFFKRVMALQSDVASLLNPDRKLLMDAYDRDLLLDNILFKLQMINGSMATILNLIEFNQNRAYIYSIPVLNNFIEQDKMLIEDIMYKYNRLLK